MTGNDMTTGWTRLLAPALAAGLLVLLAWQSTALGATTLEGYTEAYLQLSGESRVWRFDNPQFLGELRVKSTPWPDTEGYLKFQGLSNKWEGARWENFFFLKEGHLRYRGKRTETLLFTGQDRFWLNEPLLRVVNNDIIKDDDFGPKAQGIRIDFWDTWGLTGTAFYSDKSTAYPAFETPHFPVGNTSAKADTVSTDDYRGGRLKRSLFAERMILGATYGRKDYSSGATSYDEVATADFEVAMGNMAQSLAQFGRITVVGEGGKNLSGWIGDKDAYGWKLEVRDVGYGPVTMIASLYDFDPDFYTIGLAEDNVWKNDFHGHYLQLDYRVPKKAINLKAWRFRDKPHMFTIENQPREETGGEVYVEFIHGFIGKVEYKRYMDKNGTYPNVLFEVAGENKLVKIRTQFRIKDIGTDFQVRVFGFEANANLTEQWKFYSRLLTVDERTESRESVFAQIQYTGWNSAEFFLEFGDWGQSNDLANTEWFIDHANGDNTRRQFKAFLKLYY
jgi:hypothetical protein